MRRLALLLLLILTAWPAAAQEPAEVKLRKWHVGLQGVGTWRDRYDVFGVDLLPDGRIDDEGRGAGFVFGYRFGDRFLVDLQLTYAEHTIQDSEWMLGDMDALVTGTVLFRERDTVQPFLRGGVGGAGQMLELGRGEGHVFAFGTGAVAGGGLQVRLSSRVSLEFESVATFANFLEVDDRTEGDVVPVENWQVRVSSWGWRNGIGVVVWF